MGWKGAEGRAGNPCVQPLPQSPVGPAKGSGFSHKFWELRGQTPSPPRPLVPPQVGCTWGALQQGRAELGHLSPPYPRKRC